MMSELKIQVDLNLLELTTEIKNEQHLRAVHISGAIIANNCIIDNKFIDKYGEKTLFIDLILLGFFNYEYSEEIRQIAKKIENYINEQTA